MRALIRLDGPSNQSDIKRDSPRESLNRAFTADHCIEVCSPSSTDVALPSADQVSLWLGTLEASTDILNLFSSWLSPDESDRALKYKRKQDVLKFIVARGTLRSLLASMLREKPDEIQFNYNEHGKPMLKDHPNLQFNLSHSSDLMLLGISNTAQLGVDIEFIDRTTNVLQIAKRHYSESEIRSLEECEDGSRAMNFFEIWTRKEAYIKATGRGLASMLSSLPDPARAVADNWLIENIDTINGYSAAVALQKHRLEDEFRFACNRWSWT